MTADTMEIIWDRLAASKADRWQFWVGAFRYEPSLSNPFHARAMGMETPGAKSAVWTMWADSGSRDNHRGRRTNGRLGKGGRLEGSQVGYRPLDPIELYEP